MIQIDWLAWKNTPAARLVLRVAPYLPYLILVGVLLSLMAFGQKYWLTNDDIRMGMTVGGYGITAAPSTGLVMQNTVAWGWILVHLPDLGGIRAYTLATYILFLASGLAVFYALRRLEVPTLFLAAVLLSMYSFVALLPQFTLLSGYLAVAGFALVLASDERNLIGCMLAAACFLVLAGLVRPDEMGLVFLVASPFLLHAWVTHAWSWRLRWLSTAAVCGMVLVAAFLYTLHYSSTGPWQHYADITDLASEFVDYNVGAPFIRHPEKLAGMHLSLNDVRLIRFWFFLDPTVYNSANVAPLVDSVKYADRVDVNLGRVMRAVLQVFRDHDFQLLLALFLVFAAVNWRRSAIEVASLGMLLVLMAGIGLYGRPGILRIWLPAAAAMSILSLLRMGPRQGKLILALGLMCLAGALLASQQLYQSNANAARYGRPARAATCAAVPEDRIVLVWTGAAQFRWKDMYLPFTRTDDPCNPKLYMIGSYQVAPPSLDQLYTYTGGKDLVQALLAGQQFYILTSRGRLQVLDRYLQEHYQARLQWQQVAKNVFYQAFTIQAVHGP